MADPDNETILLRGARIYRSAQDRRPASALLVRAGRVAWIGDGADAPATRRVVDLGGSTVLPGLTDCHLHLFSLALARRQIAFSALAPDGIAGVLALLRQGAGRFGPGEWVQGCELNEDRLAERRLPTRAELDAAFPERPVLLRRYCGHAAVFNTMAMHALGISEAAPDPQFGHYGRAADGTLDGSAWECAAEAIFRRAPGPDPAQMATDIRAVIDECLHFGLTALCEAAVGFVIGYDREAEVWERLGGGPGLLPARMGFMAQLTAAGAAARGLSPTSGPDWTADTLKFFADGIVGGRTSALTEPFCDRGGCGGFVLPEALLADEILAAHAAGWRVAVHATGDRAIAHVAESFGRAQAAAPRPDPRHRIEHCFVPPEGVFARLSRQGTCVVMQPGFVWRMGRSAAEGLGPARMATAYPAQSVLAAGARLAFSSDAPTGPLSPWRGVQTAVERLGAHGAQLGAGEAVDLRTAVDAYIAGGVVAMGHEGFRGTLTPGAAADLAAFADDPLTGDPSRLHETRCHFAMTRGRIVLHEVG